MSFCIRRNVIWSKPSAPISECASLGLLILISQDPHFLGKNAEKLFFKTILIDIPSNLTPFLLNTMTFNNGMCHVQ